MFRPNLTHLETLCWIARLGTFTAAAERVHTTQSAVSARMKELEETLGIAIFHHRGRRAELTVEGRHIVRRAEALLNDASQLVSGISGPKAAAGVVRVGLGDMSFTVFADLMAQLRGELPGVCYEIDMDLGVNVRHKLDLGILDLIVITGRLEHANLRTAPLGSTRLVWVVSPELAYRGRRKATRDELLRESPLWCTARPSSAYTLTIDTLRALGANLDNVNTCSRLPAMAEFVARGGVGLLPEPVVADRLKRRELLLVPGVAPVSIELTIACDRNQRQPVVRYIMDAAVRHKAFTRPLHGSDSLV